MSENFENLSAQHLKDAFEKFNQSSTQLQDKYQGLLSEMEGLKAELRDKDLEVKRAERLALLGETAAAIAHEVRNPLGAIKLFLSLLRKDVEDREEAIAMINNIDKSINSIDHVVSNILHFSKTNLIENTSPININSIIQEQVEEFNPLGNAEHKVSLNLNAPPFIMGNEHSIRQVFHNLILNALQASRYKGAVSIETLALDEKNVQIVVRDDGPGINPALIENLFDPFVTGKSEGTGLGLAIVKQIVSQHGGSISASNDSGAVFKVILPIRNPKNMGVSK